MTARADSSSLTSAPYRFDAGKFEKVAALRLSGQAAAPETTDPAIARLLAERPFAKLIEGAAREAALDPALVHAVIAIESGYNQGARSPKGALGLMQVMPSTALRYGVRNAAHSPAENLRAGTRYLKELMTLFNQRLELVLAAYNAGEGAVLRYGERIPPFRETQQYVPAVLALYREWREPAPMGTSASGAAPARIRVEYMPGTALDTNALNAAGYR
ncbi:MAG: lytic transglycosylase domain-containing protein [Burkholderiales bacterium]